MRDVEPGSEDEQKFLEEHIKLLTEKDSLVRRQDYLNVAAALSEVEEKLAVVQQQVNEVTQNNGRLLVYLGFVVLEGKAT